MLREYIVRSPELAQTGQATTAEAGEFHVESILATEVGLSPESATTIENHVLPQVDWCGIGNIKPTFLTRQ